MPPYELRGTSQHPSELNFKVERHSKPKIWDINPPGTKSYTETKHCPTMTMAINMAPASHDPTLPTLFAPPTASVCTHWQHNNINIANRLDSADTGSQRNTQCVRCTPHDNLQPPDMMPPAQLLNPSHTGYKDDAQCHIPSGRPMPFNHTLQNDTPKPNIAHTDTPTHYYTKTTEKVTLQLPYHQSNHHSMTAIHQTMMGTTANTTPTNHQYTHHCNMHDKTRPTNSPTPNIAPAAYQQYIHASATCTHIESLTRQQHSPTNSDSSPQRMSQMAKVLMEQALEIYP